jgi:hypothetical protein
MPTEDTMGRTGTPEMSVDGELSTLVESYVAAFPYLGSEVRWQRQKIKSDVYRVFLLTGREMPSFIAKRLDPVRGHRNQLVVKRWLPAIGMGDSVPALLYQLPSADGNEIWHAYADLGDSCLEPADPEPAALEAATRLIAELHTRFARHPLLAECRLHGLDLGINFFSSNLRDAVRALRSLKAREKLSDSWAHILRPLEAHLDLLLEEQEARVGAAQGAAMMETFLHGDLWPSNALIGRSGQSPIPLARLIDWDHCGVGTVTYDLSTFLLRLPIGSRDSVLELYREIVAAHGFELPPKGMLNSLFDTCERGRLANRVIWPCLAALDGERAWALKELERVTAWFDAIEPVLP